jgi:hypothetical protein
MLLVRYSLFAIRYSLFAIRYSLFAAFFLLPALLHAQPVRQDPWVGPCFVFQAMVPGNTSDVLETRNLSPAADTVLHVWNDTLQQLVMTNDDRAPGDPSSIVVVQNTSSSPSVMLVFLHDANPAGPVAGTAEVWFQGVNWSPPGGVPLGCAAQAVRTGAGWKHELVGLPADPEEGVMLLLNSLGTMLGWDDSSGVGAYAAVDGVAGSTFAATGTRFLPYWSAASLQAMTTLLPAIEGRLSLLSNDWWNDLDGDGVGGQLEHEMRTCDTVSTFPWCAGVFNRRDSDRDGLSDRAEIYGIDDPVNPQYLPRWGAVTHIKDVFVEVDYDPAIGFNPFLSGFTEASMQQFAYGNTILSPTIPGAAVILGDGTAAELQHNLGWGGPRLHLDVGRNPANGILSGIWGDWGGYGACAAGSAANHGGTPNTVEAYLKCMAPVRRGVFRYAYATAGGGGQAVGESAMFRWGVGTQSNASRGMSVFIHELGHSLGISHFGHSYTGGSQMNNNPFYCSLMNYSPAQGCGARFSHGELASFQLDASSVSETSVAPVAPGLWLSPHSFIRWIDTLGSYQGMSGVDWDSNNYRSIPNVRAPLRMVSNTEQVFSNESRAQKLAGDGTSLGVTESVNPALAEAFGNRLFYFYADASGRLVYRSGLHSGSPGGGCTGDDTALLQLDSEPPCHSLDPTNGAVYFSPAIFDTVVSVSAVGWNNRLHVAWTTSTGALRYAQATGFTTGNTALSGFTTTETIVAPSTNPLRVRGQISLQIWNVKQNNVFVADQVLALTWADPHENAYRYVSRASVTGSWSIQRSIVLTTGDGISAGLGVVTIPWPTRSFVAANVGHSTVCGVFLTAASEHSAATFPQRMRVACLDPNHVSGRWVDLTSQTIGSPGSSTGPLTWGQVGLAFRGSRLASGARAVTSDRGSFWLTYIAEHQGRHVPRIVMSDPRAQWNNLRPLDGTWRFRLAGGPAPRDSLYGTAWSERAANTGVSLLAVPEVGAMKGVWIRMVSGVGPRVTADPIADATWRGLMCDSNDYMGMARRLCHQLRKPVGDADAWCGTPATYEIPVFGALPRATCAPVEAL